MKVVIIGSGNVASVFSKKIQAAGHEIIQVVGRNEENVSTLAAALNTDYAVNMADISPLADLYIIAVSDQAIPDVAVQLKLNNKLVVHTAASVSTAVLAGTSEHYGVLYPLQTLKGEMTTIPVIPVLIDGNNVYSCKQLQAFASEVFDTVTVANDEERLKLHLAAVFVNNFTNHIFAVTEQYCRHNYLDINILKPLFEETIARIEQYPAMTVQTGPAVRKDFSTIQKHRQLLVQLPVQENLYNCLTDSIIRFYDKNFN